MVRDVFRWKNIVTNQKLMKICLHFHVSRQKMEEDLKQYLGKIGYKILLMRHVNLFHSSNFNSIKSFMHYSYTCINHFIINLKSWKKLYCYRRYLACFDIYCIYPILSWNTSCILTFFASAQIYYWSPI